ncbi:MAG: DUF4296 domain-containing protein [Sphingobacteriaceae bacterium]|nr:DUF4296 domain-containing protein [Sphingobacteriaceae bacterium]
MTILFFVSCKQSAEEIPKDVIDKEKFIEVLKDKALAEAALNVNVKNVPGEKFDSVYNFSVYKENDITKAQYDSTMKYYSTKPRRIQRINGNCFGKVERRKSEALVQYLKH